MRTTLVALAALAAIAAVPLPAPAQVAFTAAFRLGLPATPTLVVIQPGVQVVQDYDDEVFLHGGTYWVRRGDHWYRSRSPQAAFVVVETRFVPEPLRRLPPGHYRRYHPPHRVEAHKLDKKEEKRLRKEEEQRRKERERGHDHEHDHDRGHDHEHDHEHGKGR